jgi:hypothetical protein
MYLSPRSTCEQLSVITQKHPSSCHRRGRALGWPFWESPGCPAIIWEAATHSAGVQLRPLRRPMAELEMKNGRGRTTCNVHRGPSSIHSHIAQSRWEG